MTGLHILTVTTDPPFEHVDHLELDVVIMALRHLLRPARRNEANDVLAHHAIGGLRDAEIAIIRVSAQPALEILLPMMADDEALQWPGGPPSHLHAVACLASHRSFRRGPRRCSSR